MLEAYLSKNQLAEKLQVSTSTIDRYVNQGMLPKPFRLIGRRVYWRKDDIKECIRSKEHE